MPIAERDNGTAQEIEFRDLRITVGRFYDREGKLLTFDTLIKLMLEDEPLKERDSVSIDRLVVDNYSAARFDIPAGERPHLNFSSTSVVTIQKGQMIYILSSPDKSVIDEARQYFRFIDKDNLSLFFPGFQDTISDSWPTFIGKIRQMETPLLKTMFKLEPFPSYTDTLGHVLTFEDGRVNGINIILDGKPISRIYGFPQFPTLGCDETHESSSGYQPYLFRGRQGVEPINDKATCIKNLEGHFPPLIFLFKSDRPLSEGKHIVTITTTSGYQTESVFTVQKSVQLKEQSLPKTTEYQDVLSTEYLDAADSCTRGYHYDARYLSIPLPTQANHMVLYGLVFPQSETEKGSGEKRLVFMEFDGRLFDLRFPQSSIFYSQGGSGSLFIPSDRLRFQDGSKAHLWVREGNWQVTGVNDSEYFELLPIDVSGRVYPESSIPWQTIAFSGCDG